MNTKRNSLFLLLLIILSTLLFAEEVVVIKGGTVLTITNGVIEEGTVIITDGKISAVGVDVEIPVKVTKTIDATGKFVMPGIIDGHSHIAINDEYNEATSPTTSQVNMAHAFVMDDYKIYQALAGGVTTTKTMHGSANVIGGLCVTMKLKWGKQIDEVIIEDARPQLKWALGENPRRFYGDKGIMPATRPGVFAVLRQSLIDAQEYKNKWDEYNEKIKAGEEATAPKKDLKKEMLADVLRGKVSVDCHCYVANEIVILLKIKDEFNIPLVSLSHALEAYKVRDLLAKYPGVTVTTHTDWWGFKWEAWDAIPYNIGMLLEKGINTTIISDNHSLIRRLNREAAKTIKYSGLTENQALRLITINAAKALEIDHRTGSLEVGKDGDVAIFDKHPLNSFSKCVMTLIEGEIWFDINDPKTAMEVE